MSELTPTQPQDTMQDATQDTTQDATQDATQDLSSNTQPLIDVSLLLSRFHAAMMGFTLISLAVTYYFWGVSHLLPCALGSGLVWLNMVVLVHGLKGVFNRQKSLAVALVLKLFGLFGGVYLLMSLFPDQRNALFVGCSTWVLATLSIGQLSVQQITARAPKSAVSSSMALILTLTLCPLLSVQAYAKPSEAEMVGGEVHVYTSSVKGSDIPRVHAVGVIKAKSSDIWAIVADCANYKQTMERILESRTLGMFNGLKRCEIVVDMPFPISNLHSVVDVKLKPMANGRYERHWKLVEGDYHRNNGSWKLTPRPDGYTDVAYQIHVEPKVSIPDFIQRAVQKSKIPGIFKRVRENLKRRGKLLN